MYRNADKKSARRFLFAGWLRLLGVAGVILSSSVCLPAQAMRPGVRPLQVRSRNVKRAIRRGVRFLLAHEHNGHWPYAGVPWNPNSQGGKSALILESLLQVGQSLHLPQLFIFSAHMRPAIKFVASLRVPATYVTSFQANAMNLLPAKKEYRQTLFWDARYLLHNINRQGGYTYAQYLGQDRLNGRGIWDNSNTQYGVLGMWACADSGMEVPLRYWVLAREHWVRTQFADGTWDYNRGPRGSFRATAGDAITMTPAGIASLLIAKSFLLRSARTTPPRQVHVIRGLKWLNGHFNPGAQNLYSLYGDERVALAAGLHTIGGIDWYKAVAADLLARQRADGSWRPDFVGSDPDIGTAYALLILSRGLNPVLISKLQYSAHYSGQWNARPFDAADYCAWVTREFEIAMNWQVLPIRTPVQQWLESPILFISGNHDPHFTPRDLAKLRTFTESGGLIFTSSDGNSRVFFRAMKNAADKIFAGKYTARPLPIHNPIYDLQPWYHPKRPLNFWAISNGVRYEWIISPVDFGGVWQRQTYTRRAFWQVPTNIYLYATGKEPLENRLQSLAVPRPKTPPARTATIDCIQYGGNWNPEPLAWPRFAALAARQWATAVKLRACLPQNLHAKKTSIAHLTGTGQIDFSPMQIAALRHYLHHGGLLFVDAAGGDPVFVDSFLRLAKAVFPNHGLKKIALTSTLIRGNYPGGVPVSRVKYRKFVQAKLGNLTGPRLTGVQWHGKWRIIFSRFDITSGLLGTNTWGIAGYTPASAVNIARDVLMYSLNKQQPLKTKPAPRPPARSKSNAVNPKPPAANPTSHPSHGVANPAGATGNTARAKAGKVIPRPIAGIESKLKGLQQ